MQLNKCENHLNKTTQNGFDSQTEFQHPQQLMTSMVNDPKTVQALVETEGVDQRPTLQKMGVHCVIATNCLCLLTKHIMHLTMD